MNLKCFLMVVVSVLILACVDKKNDSANDENMNLTQEEKLQLISELGSSGDISNAKKIAAYLSDEGDEVASSACFYLGYLNSRDYMDEMIGLLKSGNQETLNLCLSGLALIADSRDAFLLDLLYQLLESSSLLVRMGAITTIGNIGDDRSFGILRERFNDEELAAKLELIVALGKVGDREALPLLREYRNTLAEMDHSIPRKGGVRGSDPHPSVLQLVVDEAITAIEKTKIKGS